MKITIAGYGFVGKAINQVLSTHNEITIVDPIFYPEKKVYHSNPDAVILCVSTPQADDGTCDMSNVFDVIQDTPASIPILIKSTISLAGWEYIKETFPYHKICFSPEFLRADTAVEDFANMKYTIIGGEEDNRKFWFDFFVVQVNLWMTETHAEVFQIHQCTVPEAITIKYAENSFLALKVSFFNQIHDFCGIIDADFEVVRELLCMDKRINSDHSFVTSERGWGGHCFPKDTSALLATADAYGADLSVLRSAVEYNKKIRKG